MSDRSVTAFLKANVSDYQRGMAAASASTRAFTKELDTSTNRGVNLTQSILAIGPALVPIGAAAVPAISGLTNQLAFAAAGAGVTALAFSGLGDALKATNDYAIEPSAANFEKMQQSLSELGPAGREFTAFLQDIRPQLQGLQDAAQDGLLPGAEAGIRELMELLPQAEQIVSTVATTLGDLIAEAGDNLNDDRWQDFFTFLETEARPTLLDMGRTLGNFAEGFANLWMAFDPLSDQFSASFLQMSRDFALWTDGLDATDGFQEFLDFVTRVGPQVWDTLGALADALLQIVEAAAPVGEASLPIIKALADVLGTIADSPVGPALIGAAAGISAISRAIALYKVANGSAIAGLLGLSGEKGKQAGIGLRAAAAGAGIFALSMTDVDEKIGLTNTATFALAGMIAGPWGAAVGGGIGLALDLASANDETAEAFNRASAAIMNNTGTIEEQRSALAAARESGGGGFQGEVDDIVLDNLNTKLEENARAAQDAKFAEAGLSDAMANTTQATRDQTEALLDNIEKHNARASQLLIDRGGMRGFEESIDAATESLKENGRTLDINTEGGRANQAALDQIADSFNNLSAEQQSNVATQRRARDAYINTAVAMGMQREDARKLAKQLFEIPTDIRVKIAADTAAAMNKLRGIKEYIAGISGKVIKIAIQGGTPGGITRNADGGYIRGPGTTTSDSIPALLSDKEYVVKAAAVEHYGVDMFHRLNAMQYANGGRVQRFTDIGYAGVSAAPASSSGPMVASLVGAEVSVGADGLMRFVRGVVRMDAQDEEIETRFATS